MVETGSNKCTAVNIKQAGTSIQIKEEIEISGDIIQNKKTSHMTT